MSLLEYRQIRQRLSKIQQAAARIPNILEFGSFRWSSQDRKLHQILSEEHSDLELKKESSLGIIDELGRAVAIGRKNRQLRKWLFFPELESLGLMENL